MKYTVGTDARLMTPTSKPLVTKITRDGKTILRKEDKMKAWGNNRLYSMGFDGACIGTLRKLTPEQVKEVVEILNELRLKENKNGKL